MPSIGYSFQPGAQNSIGTRGQNGGPNAGSGNLRPQSAVEIKSLNLPQQRNIPSAISSPALLNATGGAAFGPQLLQMLMAAFAPQGWQPGVPSLPQVQEFGSGARPQVPASYDEGAFRGGPAGASSQPLTPGPQLTPRIIYGDDTPRSVPSVMGSAGTSLTPHIIAGVPRQGEGSAPGYGGALQPFPNLPNYPSLPGVGLSPQPPKVNPVPWIDTYVPQEPRPSVYMTGQPSSSDEFTNFVNTRVQDLLRNLPAQPFSF